MSEPIQSNIPPAQRVDAKKTAELLGKDKEADQPGVGGPGAAATAPEKPKPHDSKLLNKLDPRFDEDMLEAQQKGEVNTKGNSASK